MGLSSSSTKQTTSGATTQTPKVASWLDQPYQDLTGTIGGLIGTPAKAAAPDWQAYIASNKAAAAGPDNATNTDPVGFAQNYYNTIGKAAGDVLPMTPATPGSGTDINSLITPANANQQQAFLRAGQTDPGIAGVTAASTYQPSAITAGSLATTDLTPYLNPYDAQVRDATMAQLEQQRQVAQVNNKSAAGVAGAFGGDRDYVQRGVTDVGYDQTAASTLAGLNQTGFDKAVGLAGADINNKLQADTTNASNGLTGNAQRLAASQALSQINQSDISQLATMGEQERNIAIANNPALAQLQYLGVLDQLLAGVPIGAFTSQSGTSNSTTTSTSTPSGLQVLGGLAQAGASFFNPAAGLASSLFGTAAGAGSAGLAGGLAGLA